MHRPSRWVVRERHLAQDLADPPDPLRPGDVDEGAHLGTVAGDEQEAAPVLGEAAEFPAVVGGLCDRVPGHLQLVSDLVEQRPAAGGDQRHVLEEHQGNRVALVGREQELDAAQGEPVQRLVALGGRALRALESREPAARRRGEHDVRALALEGGVDVGCRRLGPSGRRLLPVVRPVLLPVEEVEQRAGDSGEPAEVGDGDRIDVDPAEAAEAGDDGADADVRGVEAGRAAAVSTEEVGVGDLAVSHRPPPATLRRVA